MKSKNRLLDLIVFLVRFLILSPILLVIWWELIPYYGYLLAQCAGIVGKYVYGLPLVGVGVKPEGILNTASAIFFFFPPDGDTKDRSMPIALLVTNLVPFVSLVLASVGITMRRRLIVLAEGAAIIILGHIAYVTIFLPFKKEDLARYNEVAVSATQFFLIFPVVLWLWLVYSEHIAEYIREADTGKKSKS